MNRDSRRIVHALLAAALASFLGAASRAFAQVDAAPAVDTTSAPAAEGAPQSRRDRRRAAKTEAPTDEERTQAAVAAAAPEPTADAAAADGIDDSEIVCKNIKPLGTRMAKRVCGTVAQWAAVDKKTTDAASEDMRRVRQSGVGTTTPGPAVGPP
jgi:hypothetical protein